MTGNNKVWLAPVAGLASVAMLATMGVTTANAAFKPETAEATYTVTLNVSGQSGATLGTTLLAQLKAYDGNNDFDSKSDSTNDAEVTLNSTKEEKATKATIENVQAGTPLSDLVNVPSALANREFVAWQSAGLAVDTANTKVNSDISLDARYAYTGNTVEITFVNSDAAAPVTLVKGDKLADWQIPGIANPDAGQIKGWNTNRAATNAMDLSTLDTTKNQTLYPVYGVTRTVTYDDVNDEGNITGENPQYVVDGTAFTATAEATATGKTFAGWYAAKDGVTTVDNYDDLAAQPFDFTKGTNKDITLYAKFNTAADYKIVTFVLPASQDVDGTAVAAKVYGKDAEVVKGTQVAMPEAPSDPTDQGRPFLYWTATTDAAGCNKDNRADKEYAWSNLVTTHMSLYAVFGDATKSATSTVTFDENWQNGAITEVESNADGTFTVADPEREGWQFDGWYTDATAGVKVTLSDANSMKGKTTVYAHWSRAGVDEFTKASTLIEKSGFTEKSYKAYKNAFDAAAEKYADVTTNSSAEKIAEATQAYQAAQALLKADNTVSVYRVYNKATNKHLYTTNAAEAAGLIAAGWRDEGVSFSVVSNSDASQSAQDAGLYVPVYRLFNKYDAAGNQIDRHFYTTDEAEYEKLIADPSWRDEGVAYYARTQGGEAVYRSYSSDRYEHLFTTNQTESENSVKLYGYRAEGIAFRAE